MKRVLFFSFSIALVILAYTAFAQQTTPQTTQGSLSQLIPDKLPSDFQGDLLQEVENMPPQAAEEFNRAIQRGDYKTAQKIYQEYKKKSSGDFFQDLQDMPPKTAAELNQAMQKGDFKTAQKIYRDFKKKKQADFKKQRKRGAKDSLLKMPGEAEIWEIEDRELSLIEQRLSADLPLDILTPLRQYGYETFQETISPFTPSSSSVPVGPDYIVGPGDQFTLTLWGTTEGIYPIFVSKEGDITLPKVGVVHVAGLRFGEIENTLRRHLSRYYTSFNLSVAMGKLKTITVYVVGEVTFPGSYSLSSLTTVYGALVEAGGPTKNGTMRNIQVLRSGKVIKTIDLYNFLLKGDRSQDIKLQHEDTIYVPIIGPVAGVAGTVYRPAIYEFKGQETIGDIIGTAGGIMPFALAGRIQVYRYEDQKKVILDIQVSNNPGLHEKVHNMDLITIQPLYDKVWEKVNLSGDVRYPGDYEWKQGMKLKEIILKGELLPTTDVRRAEVIRLTKDFMDREIISINLAALMEGDESQNILLQPKDHVKVYTTFREVETIEVTGEVIRAGKYEIYKGERLSDLLRRVGGFTPEAYPYGTLFKRKNVKESQAKNLQSFINKMQSQILQSAAQSTATALSSEEAGFFKAEQGINQSLLENLKAMQEEFEGRVAINITEKIDEWAGSKDDLLLLDEDSINIPKRPQEVLVLGEIYGPGAQIFLPKMRVKDYIEHAGGYTNYADKDQVFVVQANGFAFGADSPTVGNIKKVKLNAGDTIFVPQKVERQAVMRFTKDIIDILFKTAVVLATITVIF